MSGLDEQNTIDDKLTEIAVKLVLGLMRSANTETINPLDWWSRAKTALVVSASVCDRYAPMISRFLEKIQATASTMETAMVILEVERELEELKEWERFRFLCERDALYIVAMAQAEKQLRKKQ